MASPSASALAGYILERMRSDAHFLHSQGILDAAERDTIVSRLDGASHRVSSSSSVSALTTQFSAAAMTSSSNNAPPPALPQSHHQQPPPMPARMAYGAPQDSRERVKALWAYNGTQPDDLVFQKNDIIVIDSKENEHWYRGHVQSDPSARTGLFPSNYVEPYSGDPSSYTHGAQSYYASSTISSDPEKAALQPYGMQGQQPPVQSGYYGHTPPPPQAYYQQPPQGPMAQNPSPAEPGKKNRFKMPGSGTGLGNTLAHAGVGGLGFGAGSAVASNIVNAIL